MRTKGERVYAKQILIDLKNKENQVVSYAYLMHEYSATRLTIRKKIKQLQDAEFPIFPIVSHELENGRSHFCGGLMYFNGDTADDTVEELVRDSVDWITALSEGVKRLAAKYLKRKEIRRIIYVHQRRALKDATGTS